MPNQTNLDHRMHRFRVASRELFNNFFYSPSLVASDSECWDIIDNFNNVCNALFENLVLRPESLGMVKYGLPNADIVVRPNQGGGAIPALINRGIDTGYWDYPCATIQSDTQMSFLCFFDWSQTSIKDNQFVRCVITSCSSATELVGKHALINAQYVSFTSSRGGPVQV